VRRLVAAMMVVAMLGGCATYRGSRTAAKTGAVITAIGLGSIAVGIQMDHGPGDDDYSGAALFLLGMLIASIGAPPLIGGLIGLAIRDSSEPRNGLVVTPPIPAPPPPPPPLSPTQQAFGLLKTASRAAQAGDCAAALTLQVRVRELDTNVHDAWFVRDVAIKQCLDAASGATPPSPPSEAAASGSGDAVPAQPAPAEP